jgi:D-3-phosphoglycerate dehydrogenase
MTKALITCHHLQRHFPKFEPQYQAAGVATLVPRVAGQQLDTAGMLDLVRGIDGIIAGDDEIDRAVLEAGHASRLKVVVKWGIGTDSIDKETARRLGIPVYNTPGVFSDEVADVALGMLLMLTRQLHRMHQSVLDGGWLKVEGRTLAGMTAGIVGLGSIGLGIARRATAFGMNVIGSDVAVLPPGRLAEVGARQVSFDQLLAQSDVVLLACNLTGENRHLIDAVALSRMRPATYLVNVSRGPLVDERALVAALHSGHLAGAALDVFEAEPLPAESPLRHIPQCVLGTHNGSNTQEAVARVNQMATDILLHALSARPLTAFVPNRVA